MHRLGINVEGVSKFDDQMTARFFVSYENDFSTRTLKIEVNALENLGPNILPMSYLNSKYAHICVNFPQRQLDTIKRLKNYNPDTVVSIDTTENYILLDNGYKIREVIEAADIIFLTKREKSLISNHFANKIYVTKDGKNGADYSFKDLMFHADALNISDVVDTTGAGDVLAGALLAQISKGIDIEKALSSAVKLASRSVRNFGVDHLIR